MIDRLIDPGLWSQSRSAGLAWTLVWQSTIWLTIGLVAARVWRRRAGRAHLLLTLATWAAVISPLLTLVVQRMEWGVLPPAPVVAHTAPEPVDAIQKAPPEPSLREEPLDFPIERKLEEAPDPSQVSTPPADVDAPVTALEPTTIDAKADASSGSWTTRLGDVVPRAIAGLWLAVSLVLTIRLILSLFAGWRIARQAREEQSPRLLAALSEAAEALSLKSVPRLRVSPFARCPVIWCWGSQPVVLLPASAIEQAPILWRSVFCHELAHLVRCDHWSALCAEVVVIILPWQPLAWRCRRQLAFLREQACDDWVLAAGGAATDYAESLLQFVPQGSPVHALAAVSSRESLKRRLEHVLSGMRIAPNVGRRWIVAASLVALVAITGVGFAQQGKRAPATSPEPASNSEIAKETQPPASNASQPAVPQTPTPALPPGVVVLRGRVLLPNGQPAAGATVRAVKSVFRSNLFGQPPESKTVLATFTADSQGDFGGNVAAGRLKDGEITLDLWATLPGYGLALHPIKSAEKTDLIVMSLADEEPIRGRIMDLEGRPVRDVRVEVVQYFDTTAASIDKWIATVQGKETEYRSAVLPTKSSAWVLDALIPPLKTNSEGLFEVKGIGRDRRVNLRISGPRVALTGADVITRPIKPIGKRFFQIFGSQFDRVVSPSVLLEGFVTDEESGKPIPGVRLDPSAWGYAPTTTDDRGHYRFDSLTPGSHFTFYLRVLDLPYFSEIQGFPIPAAVSLEPIRKDFKLKRGVWAVGRAYNRVTGKPVSGTVYYNPYLSNEFARKFASNDRAFWQGLYDCGRADAEGRIRAVVIPGRGVVSLQCESGDYRFDFGLAQIKEITEAIKARRASPLYNAFWPELYHAVREINVAPGASETTIDLPVDPGQNVVLKFVDAAGNRLAGVEAYGLRFVDALRLPERGTSFVEGDSATLYAAYPEETRTIWLRHRSSGLAKLFRFTPKAGETERTIILEPPAIATGRVVTSEGKPIAEMEVQADIGSGSNKTFPPVLTDSEGRFRRDLPAGGPIRLFLFPVVTLPELTAVGGEQIDFGEIAIERDAKQPWKSKVRRGPEKRTRPPVAAESSTAPAIRVTQKADAPKPATSTTIREVRGRVLLPNGQPARGATVRAMTSAGWPSNPQIEAKLLGTFSTNAEGLFEGKISAPLGARPASATRRISRRRANPVSGDDEIDVNLWATLPGYGLTLVSLDSIEGNEPIVMHLAEEEPIRGHMLDLEGQPIRDAKIEVITYLQTMSSSVDQFVASTLATKQEYRDALVPENKVSEFAPTAIFPAAKSNSEGRFELKGVGRDRIVELRMSAPRMTATIAWVLTRPIKPIPLRFQELCGSQFERAIPPSVPVEGFVTDEENGKPIPGVRIRQFSTRGLIGIWAYLSATTDVRGHYRIDGLETVSDNELAFRVSDSPYFSLGQVNIPPAKSLEPIRKDVKLRRGIWAVGRAYDRATGKPVAGRIVNTPFPSNELAGKFSNEGFWNPDADGHFRAVVLPGRSVLCLECSAGDYRFDFGKSAIEEFAGPNPSAPKNGNSDFLPTNMYHSVRAIDVPPNAQEIHVDLPVDPGQNVVLKFTDAAGKPLAGIETSGLRSLSSSTWTRAFADGDSAILHATYAGESRRVWLRQRASGLTRLVDFVAKAGETERSLILEPPAVVIGRLISTDGAPLVHVPVRAASMGRGWTPSELATGEDGRFRVELPGGGPFALRSQWLDLVQNLTVEAGEQIDLGDITIEQRGKRMFMDRKVQRGPVKRTKAPGAAQASTTSGPATGGEISKRDTPKPGRPTTLREVRGRVLLPNGQPAAGATVRAIKYAFNRREGRPIEVNVLALVVADSLGTFQASLPIGATKETSGADVNLWATLPGYGLARHSLSLDETSGPIVINLFDEEPIRGRILDLEGQPVRDARVEIIRYFDTTTPWVEQWLASARGITPGTTFFAVAREETKPGRDEKGLRIKSTAPVSEVVIPAVKTNADGRFEIKGLGRDRLIDLAITGPRITTIGASVLTRPIKPIPFRYREISGSQFERVVPPSVPFEGVVADEETGKPIPGAIIIHTAVARGNGILGDDPSMGFLLSGTTDARGSYRLEGLETRSANYFKIIVPDLPYLPVENASIPGSTTLQPIRHDIKLRCGVWAVGRAFDRTDGKAVSGMVYYTPFRSNEFARNYERYRNQPTDFLANYPFGHVDADGRFKIPVIPGRGVVCLKCTEGNYRPNLGRGEIKELAGSDQMTNPMRGTTYERLLSEPFHAVREINVPLGARETHVDLPVDPGQSVVLNFTDEAGSPLSGLDTYGLRLDWRSIMDRSRSSVEGSSATLYASTPDETRTIWIRHRASGLFGLFHFTPSPRETARTMVLEPPAVVTGRLVTPEGAPVSGSEIEVVFAPNSADRLPGVKTDAEGRFRQELPSGGPFELYAHPFPYAFFAEKLSVVAGERVELGEITIDRDQKTGRLQPKIQRGPEKRTKLSTQRTASPASEPSSGASQGPKAVAMHSDSAMSARSKPATSTAIRQVRGRVLLPNGQPAVGATVTATKSTVRPDGRDELRVLATFHAGANGQFEGTVDLGSMTNRRDKANLWATLPGYGLALHPLTLAEKADVIVMNLVEDEPIRGHLIDLQGQPVRDARVEVITFYDSTAAWVDQFLASVKDKPFYTHWVLPGRSLDENKGGREQANFRVKAIASVSDALIPSQRTNADGRFEISGIGRDRHIYLRVSGPRIATSMDSIVTRPIKPIPFKFHETFGSQFERVASPSVPVEGFVTDEATGKPVAGVEIHPYAVKRGAATLMGDNRLLSATSDSNGHFRLEGLDTGRINLCRIQIPDSPYLTTNDATVPAAISLEPIRLDIKLRRAIWAVGRAYDRSTGKPVSGVVSYTPFRSNELAAKYFSAQNPFLTSVNTGAVDADGRFRLAVIPGRGVVCLQCTNGLYRFDLGRTAIKELANAKRSQSPTLALLPANSYHSLHEINVAQDAREVSVDLPVEPGQNVDLKFTDAAGKPLSGVEADGLRFDLQPGLRRGRSFAEGDSATLYATFPGESRAVRLRHRASGLTRLFQFTPQPGETGRTIVLEPPAVVTGRLVSDEGTPHSNIKIEFYSVVSSTPVALPPVITDAKGHFRQELPAGGPFNSSASDFGPGLLVDGLTVAAGEQIDLGDITIEPGANEQMRPKIHLGPVKRTGPAAAAKASTASAPDSSARKVQDVDSHKPGRPRDDAPQSGKATTIHGTVLRPDGQPAAGATVAAFRYDFQFTPRPRRPALASTTADHQGRFELTLPKSQFRIGTGHANPLRVGFIVAEAEGFGLQAVDWGAIDAAQPLTLKLTSDSPIRGRVLDLEGRPVPGVTVVPTSVNESQTGSLDLWLGAVRAGHPSALASQLGKLRWIAAFDEQPSQTVTTDSDGRFTIKGIGPERLVGLELRGESTALTFVTVATRPMPPLTRLLLGLPAPRKDQVFGSEFTCQVDPSRVIVGTVSDAATGEPLKGVGVAGDRWGRMWSETDAQGRYRLVGVPKGSGKEIMAFPNDDQPYFLRGLKVPDSPGIGPITVDFKLHRGLRIVGRVIDQVTRQPVMARLHYLPFLDNPFLGKLPEFREGGLSVSEMRYTTRPDGTFRLVGLPGRAIVGAFSLSPNYRTGQGAEQINGVDKNGHFPTFSNPAPAGLKWPTAIKEINPAEGSNSVNCDFVLEPGGTIHIALVDRDGKPVSGATVTGRIPMETQASVESKFDVANLSLNETRPVVIFDKKRDIGKVLMLTFDEKTPRNMTVTLEPSATLTGRIVDEDGAPVTAVALVAYPIPGGDFWPTLPPSAVQADGRFEYRGLLAGADCRIVAGPPNLYPQALVEKFRAQPGKTIDLGEIKLRRGP